MIMNSKCRGCFRDLPENCVDRISILAAYKSQYNLSTIIFESVGLKIDQNDGGPKYLCVECADKLIFVQNVRAMLIETDKRFQSLLKALPNAVLMNAEATNTERMPYYNEDQNISLDDADDYLTEALSNVFGWDLFPVANETVTDVAEPENTDNVGASVAATVDIDKNLCNLDLITDNLQSTAPIPSILLSGTIDHGQGILSDITEIIAQENAQQISEIDSTICLNAAGWFTQDFIDSSDDTFSSLLSTGQSTPASIGSQSPSSIDSQYPSSLMSEPSSSIDSISILFDHLPQPLQSPSSSTHELYNVDQCLPQKRAKFVCIKCESTFSRASALERHLPLHNQKQTQCPQCPKAFSHASNLRRHLVRHNQKSRYTCDFCDEAFPNSNALIDHLKVHSDALEVTNKVITTYVLECEVCGYKTLSYAGFINHMRNNHPEADTKKVFKCRICGEGFCTKQGMFRHIDNIHENNRLNLRNQKKNFLCNLCGKSFFSNVQLIVHERTHNGDRPFKCKFCPKSFAQITGLKMHTYTHTGERPFICRICDKTFTQPGHLKEHLLLHEGVKPHICSICNHSFRVKGNLTAHMLTHIGMQKPKQPCNICGKHFPNRSKFLAHKMDCKEPKEKECL